MKPWDSKKNWAFYQAVANNRYDEALSIAHRYHVRSYAQDFSWNDAQSVWAPLSAALEDEARRSEVADFMHALTRETNLNITPRLDTKNALPTPSARLVRKVVDTLQAPVTLLEPFGVDPRDPFYDRIETGMKGPIPGREERCQELGGGDSLACERRRARALDENRRMNESDYLQRSWQFELRTGNLISAAYALPHIKENWFPRRRPLVDLCLGLEFIHNFTRNASSASRHFEALSAICEFLGEKGEDLEDTLARLDILSQTGTARRFAVLGYSGREEHVQALLPIGLTKARRRIQECLERTDQWKEGDEGIRCFTDWTHNAARKVNARSAEGEVTTRQRLSPRKATL